MGIGIQMKKILRDKKMTIKQLSEKSGISLNTLYSITKRDSVRVDAVILLRMVEALDIPVRDFYLGGGGEMLINTAQISILMAKQGINQRELGEKCRISRQNISSILRRGSAQPKTVGKLANGLGVPVEELVVLGDFSEVISKCVRQLYRQGENNTERRQPHEDHGGLQTCADGPTEPVPAGEDVG